MTPPTAIRRAVARARRAARPNIRVPVDTLAALLAQMDAREAALRELVDPVASAQRPTRRAA